MRFRDFFSSQTLQPRLIFVLCWGAPSFTNVDPAIHLFHSGLVENIIITGFGPTQIPPQKSFIPEYAGIRDRALQAGVPSESIFVEKTATNTLENFVRTEQLIRSKFSWERTTTIAIAGKPLHMRRALMTARSCWPAHIHLLMQPTTAPSDLQASTWWQSRHGQQTILTELSSIDRYWSRGDICGD